MLELSTSTTPIIFGEPARQLVTRLYGEESAVRTSKWCYSQESNNVPDNLLGFYPPTLAADLLLVSLRVL
jgi:hypothetical protein